MAHARFRGKTPAKYPGSPIPNSREDEEDEEERRSEEERDRETEEKREKVQE